MLAARDALADGCKVEGVSGAAEEAVRNPEPRRRRAMELANELPMVKLGCVYAVEDGGHRAWNAIYASASHQFGEDRDRQRLGRGCEHAPFFDGVGGIRFVIHVGARFAGTDDGGPSRDTDCSQRRAFEQPTSCALRRRRVAERATDRVDG